MAHRWGFRACLSGMVFLAGGCILYPEFGPPPQVGPPRPPVTQTAAADTLRRVSAADSAAADLNRLFTERYPGGVVPISPEDIRPRPHPAPPSDGPAAPVSNAPPPAVPAASPAVEDSALADSSALSPSRAPAISVDLPPEEMARLETNARADLAWADSTARATALRTIPPRDRDKLETALGLVRQGQEALRRGDIRAAANLAYKARLLVQEVAPK